MNGLEGLAVGLIIFGGIALILKADEKLNLGSDGKRGRA